jgi:Ca2+/Na+ antiporter
VRITITRRTAFRLWLALFPAFFVLWYFPYIDFPIRVATWVVALLVLMGAVYFSWRVRVMRWLLIALYALAVLFLVWPSHRPVDRSALRSDYCAALKSYLGSRYVWGGEGYLGIDCSGLVQRGLIDALATRGFATLNPALVRDSLSLYWHRTTAKVIGEGYAGRTDTVTTCPTLNALDYSLVQRGDLAVTAGGDHVMAYLGNRTWIAADPGVDKVTTFTIPEQRNAYFSTPMRIVRWKILTQ